MIQIKKKMILIKQVVSKISAEKDGFFFARVVTDTSVTTRATIEASCFKWITASAMIFSATP